MTMTSTTIRVTISKPARTDAARMARRDAMRAALESMARPTVSSMVAKLETAVREWQALLVAGDKARALELYLAIRGQATSYGLRLSRTSDGWRVVLA